MAATVGVESSLDLSDYFSDADGDALVYARESGVGTVTGSTWTYTPAAAGSFSAVVSATDPSGASATMAIAVTAEEPQLPILDTPTGLAVVSVSESGFTVSWDAVANAGSYSVSVLDGNDTAAGTVSVSGTSATVSGLSADTDYSVKVKALAPSGDTPYLDSGWSDSVTIATDLVGGLKRATLFNETFDKVEGTGWSNSGALQKTDESGWTTAGNVYRAPEGLRLGSGSNPGSATTREIMVLNDIENAEVVVSFLAASYTGKKTAGTLTLSNTVTGVSTVLTNLNPAVMSNDTADPLTGGTPYEFMTTVPARFTLRFESLSSASDKRLLLDSIKVTQVYDPDYAALAAPTDVVGSDAGKYGFTVSWTGVANAAGYEVWLNGSLAESCASTDSSVALTGLQDGTAYSVQVRALGDNLHYGDSPLTTAVSVETEEDVQSIVFTVTGAPAGDVYAGDPVSFTVAAAVESTGEAALVNFSGIAGATFENGTFSWTPAEADAGTNVATFASGTYSTNVAVSVVSAFRTETIAKEENFSQIASSSWTSTSGYLPEIEGDLGTWTGHDLIKTKRAVIVGRANTSGTIVSPAVSLKVQTGGSLSVSFETGSLPEKKASIQAQILDAADDKVLYTTNFPTVAALPSDATAVSDAGARFSVEPDDFVSLPSAVKIAFTTYASEGDDSQRAYVDTVVFSQTVSAKIRDLAAPTGLALVGEAGENGFTVGWNTVDGATNYAVRVLDATGAVAASAPFCAAPSFAATDLPDDEVYMVQVRATGDSALWFASDWSAPVAVRTARSALHPTLRLGAWSNVAGENHPVATLANTAAATAELGDGSAAILSLTGVSPAPAVAPVLSAGTLSWSPAEADAGKTFTLAFSMQADAENAIAYATNVAVAVTSLPATKAPDVTVESVSWERFVLSWTTQYRATNYAVRAWTGPEDPEADGTTYTEYFTCYPDAEPDGWVLDNGGEAYTADTYWATRVKFTDDGFIESPLFGGGLASVSFRVRATSGSAATLTVFGWDGAEWVELETYGADTASVLKTETKEIALGGAYTRIRWEYARNGGVTLGLGSFEFAGSGLPTARFLTGWSSRSKLLGNVAGATVDKVRPGEFLGRSRDPGTGEWIERGTTRRNWAEVTVFGTDGQARSTVVQVAVPWMPYAKRATLIVVQ